VEFTLQYSNYSIIYQKTKNKSAEGTKNSVPEGSIKLKTNRGAI
jgi:hypothetical protein